MRLELSDGEILELSESDTRTLYEALLERARQHGASSAAGKLRSALTWSGGAETKVTLTRFESAAVQKLRADERSD